MDDHKERQAHLMAEKDRLLRRDIAKLFIDADPETVGGVRIYFKWFHSTIWMYLWSG